MSKEYFNYLKTISWKGKLYRNFIVYPLIRRYCKGFVLDVGCGTGQFLAYIKDGIGVDINQDCVQFCKKKGLHAHLMIEDLLPFTDQSFDTLIMDNVLEHIIDPGPILRECARVLKPGGSLIILVPGEKGYAKDPDHKNFYNFRTLNTVLSYSGFSISAQHNLPILGLSRWLSSFCFMVVAQYEKN